MTLEVLLSTMHQQNMDIVSSCNIKTDTVIVNQCEEDNCVCEQRDGQRIKWINSSERGLSKSRNMALASSGADICLLCDEDVKYYNNYEKIVKKAFKKLPQADVIIFDIDEVGNIDKRKKATVISKVPFYKTFGSVHIAFKRNVIIKKNIRFNENFGAGSGKYAMAEDALLFREFTKKRLKVYRYPATISKVAFEGSTWFEGFTERYFYDGNEVSTKFMKESVTDMFGGLRIDEYFEINLSAIEKLNNGVGGVEVIIPYEGMEKSDPSFVKGEKVYLTGELVEKFLRFRDTSEDFSATKRLEIQREYLRAYQEKVKSLNEDSIVEKLLNDIEPYSHTDMSKDMLLKLLTCVMETDNFDGESVTILEGEDKKTELYDEFYPDKEAAMTKIIELFYDME